MQARKPVIFLDSACFATLDASVRESPISELRLRIRAQHSLEDLGVSSIGDLIDMARRGIRSPPAAGRKTAANIAGALHALARSVMPDGGVDWVRYATESNLDSQQLDALLLKSKPIDSRCVHFGSPVLDELGEAVRRRSIKSLHLRARALHALETAGINSIGELIDGARRGIADLRAAGQQTRSELLEVLHALEEAVRPNDIDLVQYAVLRDFQILPERDCANLSPCDFPKVLAGSLQGAVESCFGQPGKSLYEEYFFRNDSETSSLRRIARRLGLTHQAVSLRMDRILGMLRGALLEDNYTACRFRFRDTLAVPFRRLRARLMLTQNHAFRHSDWKQAVAEIWGPDSANLGALESLLQAILGFEVVHPCGKRFERIILPKNRGTSAFAAAQRKIERLLKFQFPCGLSEAEILEQVRCCGETDLTPEEITTLIHSVRGIEYVAREKRFRFRIAKLTRLSDQLERILAERRSPMQRRELALEVSRFEGRKGSVRSAVHVGSAMSGDKRFRAIGRSGYWGLARWEIEAGTIADVVVSCLQESGESLTRAELYTLVAARRPVKMSSLRSVLQKDGRFRFVPPRTWQLKKPSGGGS